MRANPSGWAWTALVTSALIFAASAGHCEAVEPDRRSNAGPAAGVPAPPCEAEGLSPVRPYVRGKIPVVLIHGLGSSPRSWAPMIEGLEADPILRATYQFWTFGYPTGEPILYSASVLRRTLLLARAQYDPDASDPAFDRIVLVGHSLGGLLAKVMAQNSQSRLWETVSAQPAERLDGPAEARECLHEAFLFKPLPGVRRLIFIATPHRGSRVDRGAVRALGTRLFQHGDSLQRTYATLLASNRPDFFLDAFREGLPTSVDQLTWDHPLLLALRDAGIDQAVTYHSIIADRRDPPRAWGTDGVVPYASAHLDGAASELLIHDGHLCQADPLVIRECRRILTEHLVRIATQPGGDRADALDADPGRRPTHHAQAARNPLRPPAPRVVPLTVDAVSEDRAVVGLGPLGTPGPLWGLEAGPAQQPPDAFRKADGPAAQRHYMVIYAAQEPGNHPRTSHCFATFARVAPEGASSEGPWVELHHINWFSSRGHQRGFTSLVEDDGRPTRPEPGENRTTREALELVLRGGRRVTRWGPYAIDRGLYERALRQIDLLEGRVPGREVLYKAIDLGYREGSEIRALNCIHAVSDVVHEPDLLRTWTTYGDEAARQVVRHLRPWIKGPAVERPDVWPAIWDAIWQGAPTPMADTLVQADIESGPAALAEAGRAEDLTAAASANLYSR